MSSNAMNMDGWIVGLDVHYYYLFKTMAIAFMLRSSLQVIKINILLKVAAIWETKGITIVQWVGVDTIWTFKSMLL